MKKRIVLLTGALIFSISVFACAKQREVKPSTGTQEPVTIVTDGKTRDYKRIVVISDAHYPSKTRTQPARDNIIAHKLAKVEDINQWKDVDLLVFPGDIVQRTGNLWEYNEAKGFTDRFTAPKAFIPGNHAFMFASKLVNGKAVRASLEERAMKLQRFAKTFGLQSLYYGQEMAGYYLVFLSPEVASGKYPTELSQEELSWLKQKLKEHKAMPTICFFHAPLKGSLENYNKNINSDYYVAHPVESIRNILAANPQVKLWVSGHTHTKATNKSFAAPVNKVGSVVDIHNPSWESKTIWTNSLYLYPDKIIVRTYNHDKHKFVKKLDRTFYIKQDQEQTTAQAA